MQLAECEKPTVSSFDRLKSLHVEISESPAERGAVEFRDGTVITIVPERDYGFSIGAISFRVYVDLSHTRLKDPSYGFTVDKDSFLKSVTVPVTIKTMVMTWGRKGKMVDEDHKYVELKSTGPDWEKKRHADLYTTSLEKMFKKRKYVKSPVFASFR